MNGMLIAARTSVRISPRMSMPKSGSAPKVYKAAPKTNIPKQNSPKTEQKVSKNVAGNSEKTEVSAKAESKSIFSRPPISGFRTDTGGSAQSAVPPWWWFWSSNQNRSQSSEVGSVQASSNVQSDRENLRPAEWTGWVDMIFYGVVFIVAMAGLFLLVKKIWSMRDSARGK